MKPGRLPCRKGTKEAMSLMGMELWVVFLLGRFEMLFFFLFFLILKMEYTMPCPLQL